MWEKRMISLKLMTSLAIVIVNFPTITTPIQMKLKVKKFMKYFTLRFQIHYFGLSDSISILFANKKSNSYRIHQHSNNS
ncbi:unnamed protein product [Paramecium sonneborni]|uniref:Uncharacterized protein n=1 Tax=Paramecium sonneborni TaxID=65129 RepID=A0A8S1RMY2_9CILI|nr:unnamed protein product [Paramecium sonneborni]